MSPSIQKGMDDLSYRTYKKYLTETFEVITFKAVSGNFGNSMQKHESYKISKMQSKTEGAFKSQFIPQNERQNMMKVNKLSIRKVHFLSNLGL